MFTLSSIFFNYYIYFKLFEVQLIIDFFLQIYYLSIEIYLYCFKDILLNKCDKYE